MASYNLNLVRVVERPEQYFPRKQLCTRLPDGGLFRYTYADFGPRVRRLASALASIGVRAGDTAATLAWNTHAPRAVPASVPARTAQ
jgi:fatty-acyl-CoA synthase